jgi:CRISPR/Cas system-associated exonuclease Cas4 (RecB family)
MKLYTIDKKAAARPLSPSQVSKWVHCPAAWYFKYQMHLEEPPTAPLVLGRAVHSAIGYTLAAELAGEEWDEQAALATYEAAFSDAALGAYFAPDEQPEEIEARGAKLVTAWATKGPALIEGKLLHSEYAIEGEISGVPVVGVADIVTTETVCDVKVRKRKPSNVSQLERLQIATYAFLIGAKKGQLITLVHAARGPSIHTTSFEIGQDLHFVERIYPQIRDAIEAERFLPNRFSQLCSRRFCPHWRVCEEVYGGEVRP